METSSEEITIITAFFNCGRDRAFYQSRSDEVYFEYFKFWARIQNVMVIYTSPEYADIIWKIRKQFHREQNTIINVVDNIWEKEKNLYERMKQVENSSEFVKWRFKDKDISNNADYDYIMLMKYWCMKDAVKQFDLSGMLAWVDFGYNHGGKVFSNPEEFDFYWKYPFESKIHLFSLENPDNDTGIIRFQNMTDSIMGTPVICPGNMCEMLYEYCKQAMYSLISLDCYDDDQMLLRMAYKMNKEIFKIHITDWFLPIKEFGNQNLSINNIKTPAFSLRKKICNKIFKCLHGNSKEMYEFIKRLKNIIQ